MMSDTTNLTVASDDQSVNSVEEDCKALLGFINKRDETDVNALLEKYEFNLKDLLSVEHFRELAKSRNEDKHVVECVIKHAVNYDFADVLGKKDEDGFTPLLLAVSNALKNNDTELFAVIGLLVLGAEPPNPADIKEKLQAEITDETQATFELITELLTAYRGKVTYDEYRDEQIDAAVKKYNHTDKTELMQAVEENNLTVIKSKLGGCDADYVARADSHGWNVFHYLATSQKVELIAECFHDAEEKLVKKGVLDAINNDRQTPLQLAISKDNNIAALWLLILGADANLAINSAVDAGSVHLTEMMIVFGADVNHSEGGQTPRDRAEKSKLKFSDTINHKLKDLGGKTSAELQKSTHENGVMKAKEARPSIKSERKDRKDRVLTLDGGGIRGLVEILLMQAIEDAVGQPIQKCFNWFFGTSTGGILALAIANGFSLRYCFAMYMKLKDNIFKSGKTPYDTKTLEKFLKREFRDMEMRKTSDPELKVAVTSVLLDQERSLVWFRNYGTDHHYDAVDAAPAEREYDIAIHTTNKHITGSRVEMTITLVGKSGEVTFSLSECKLIEENGRSQINVFRVQTKEQCGNLTAIRFKLGEQLANTRPHCIKVTDKTAGTLHIFPIVDGEVDKTDCQQSDVETLSKVWHAARATSAAPTYFNEFYHHVDGGMKANNPTPYAIREVDNFHKKRGIKQGKGIVVSLGTGKYQGKDLGYCTIPLFCIWDVFAPISTLRNIWQFVNSLVCQVTETDGTPVETSKHLCDVQDVPFQRLQPELSEPVGLDCTNNQLLIGMLFDTKKFIYDHQSEFTEMAEIIDST